MGAQLLPLPVTATAPPPPSPFQNLKFPVPKRRRFANSPPTAAPRWDSNAETVRTQRFRFNDFVSDDDDDDDEDYEFDFGRKEEQRTWWFDDSPGIDDDGEFEFWEESVDGFGVVFKVQTQVNLFICSSDLFILLSSLTHTLGITQPWKTRCQGRMAKFSLSRGGAQVIISPITNPWDNWVVTSSVWLPRKSR